MISVSATAAVAGAITTDWVSWDRLNVAGGAFATSELSRAFLASCILVLDLAVVMQDWDFPHFTSTLDVKLPGVDAHEISFRAVQIEISGKWFNYGIIFLVMLFDLNMWKNQIWYEPERYGQYAVLNKVIGMYSSYISNSSKAYRALPCMQQLVYVRPCVRTFSFSAKLT